LGRAKGGEVMKLHHGLCVLRSLTFTTQKSLSLFIGISVSYYNEIEKGKKEPTITLLRKITHYYNSIYKTEMSVSDFMKFTERTDLGKHLINKVVK
jgi:DNA-binding XRE family transcriptional regulator